MPFGRLAYLIGGIRSILTNSTNDEKGEAMSEFLYTVAAMMTIIHFLNWFFIDRNKDR
jgi:hypothetical protein